MAGPCGGGEKAPRGRSPLCTWPPRGGAGGGGGGGSPASEGGPLELAANLAASVSTGGARPPARDTECAQVFGAFRVLGRLQMRSNETARACPGDRGASSYTGGGTHLHFPEHAPTLAWGWPGRPTGTSDALLHDAQRVAAAGAAGWPRRACEPYRAREIGTK